MRLSNKEKETIFPNGVDYYISENIEPIMATIFFERNRDEEKIKTTIDLLKRIICENLKNQNINYDENVSYDIDNLLEQIMGDTEELPGFKKSYFKDLRKLDIYFNELINASPNSSQAEHYKVSLEMLGGDIKNYMISQQKQIISNVNNLYHNVEEIEQEKQDVFDNLNDGTVEYNSENILNFGSDNTFQDWGDFGDNVLISLEDDSSSILNNDTAILTEEKKLSPEQLIEFLKYLNTILQLKQCYDNYSKITGIVREKIDQMTLNEFYSNEELMQNFIKIMEHDPNKNQYWFHGTTNVKDAYSICEQGLGIKQSSIDSTAVKELNIKDLILYRRGIGNEIGRDAIVIIDMPIVDKQPREDIVKPISDNKKINFGSSGLQGLNIKAGYIIEPEYIVGIINKKDKKIEYNPKYYDYGRFNIEDETIKGTIKR